MNRLARASAVLAGAAFVAHLTHAASSIGAADPRTTVPLTAGWRFLQGEKPANVLNADYDDSSWERVDLPHTWNRLGNAGTERSARSNLVQGTGWYRVHFDSARPGANSRFFLQFDGVGAVADVWLNGQHLCRHAGAFARFRCDATAAIHAPGQNLLVVSADNSRPGPGASTEDVIPLSGDFFVFGGLYRGVALIVTDAVHVDLLDYGGPGLYARALEIRPAAAMVDVVARLVNDGPAPQRVIATTTIENAAGAVVGTERREETIAPNGAIVAHSSVRVPRPRLWQGIRDPYQYRVVLTLRSPDRFVRDRVAQPLGLRTVRIDPDEGLFLNGQHLRLNGVAMHQDRADKGWAVGASDREEDFRILADLGANAIRLAHYQHDQGTYELADDRGFVTWAEIPLVNQVSQDGSAATAALASNARQQLMELIRQNYNHPSIVVWSIANEIDLFASQKNGWSRTNALLGSLNALAKSEDPGRLTALADCCEPSASTGAATTAVSPRRDADVGITDTVGYNRYFGWYYGTFGDLGPMLDTAHARHPSLPLSVSEYGAGAALSQHTDDPSGGSISTHGRPHPEEYQSLYHEQSWNSLRSRRYLWGTFVWNLFDFCSPSRREGDLSDINDKGLVSYDRTVRKDAFFFYRANWSREPTLHLTGRRYIDRDYAVLDVEAYSNADRASLWVNNSSRGTTACAGGICRWRSVHLRRGENEIRATAKIGGAVVSDRLQWTVRGSPAAFHIKAGDLSGYAPSSGDRYGSDAYFSGGEGRRIESSDSPKPGEPALLAEPPELYDTYREGSFSYHAPVPPGSYRVHLRFVEPMALAAGARVFDVIANGTTVLKDFDVFEAAGARLRGVDREFEVVAGQDGLRLEFRPLKLAAIVSALSITPLESPSH